MTFIRLPTLVRADSVPGSVPRSLPAGLSFGRYPGGGAHVDRGAGWVAAVAATELPDGKAIRAQVDGADVLLVRSGERVFAVSNRCTHQGAALHRGLVHAAGSLPSVTCPAHGSRFQLTDGRVLRPPATAPLPEYEARIEGETVEIRPIG